MPLPRITSSAPGPTSCRYLITEVLSSLAGMVGLPHALRPCFCLLHLLPGFHEHSKCLYPFDQPAVLVSLESDLFHWGWGGLLSSLKPVCCINMSFWLGTVCPSITGLDLNRLVSEFIIHFYGQYKFAFECKYLDTYTYVIDPVEFLM